MPEGSAITELQLCTRTLEGSKRLVFRDNMMHTIMIAVSAVIGALTVQEHFPSMLIGGFTFSIIQRRGRFFLRDEPS